MSEAIKWDHECDEENAVKFLDWIRNRGGVAVWKSVDLGDPSASWSTPLRQANGDPATRPSWKADTKPSAVHNDATKIGVYTSVLVETIPASLRRNGMQLVLSKGTAKRLDAALRRVKESHGNSFYRKVGIIAPELHVCSAGPMISLQEWSERRDPIEQEVA